MNFEKKGFFFIRELTKFIKIVYLIVLIIRYLMESEPGIFEKIHKYNQDHLI